MSTTAQPYSQAARGRMPMPAWLRLPLIGASIVGVFAVMGYMLEGPSHKKDIKHGPDWSPGKAMPLPVAPPDQAVTTTAPSKPAGLPGPTNTTSVAGPGVPLMITWGQEPTAPKQPQGASGGVRREADGIGDDDAPDGLSASVYKSTSYLLPQGREFSCLLQQPANTILAGDVMCKVDEPGGVMSDDGSNVLLGDGAMIHGHVMSGVKEGQNRIVIIWDNFRDGRVHGSLGGSHAVDGLGQEGAPGIENDHWGDVFKMVGAFTAMDTASNVINNETQKSGNTTLNLGQGTSMAEQALQNQLQVRQPTIEIPPLGLEVQVQVHQNIWFNKVYRDVIKAGVE